MKIQAHYSVDKSAYLSNLPSDKIKQIVKSQLYAMLTEEIQKGISINIKDQEDSTHKIYSSVFHVLTEQEHSEIVNIIMTLKRHYDCEKSKFVLDKLYLMYKILMPKS